MLRSFHADAADAATLGAAGRGQAASAVACAASAALGRVHQLGQNPARPMAMPVAMPVAMPTPIVKAVVKPVVKPSQWIYALLQSSPGRSTRWSSVEGVVLACLVAPTCDSNQTRNV